MKKISIVLFLMTVVLFSACKKSSEETPSESTKATQLKSTPWKLNRVTDPTTNRTIDKSRLGVATTAIFEMYIEFQTNNRVRSVVAQSGQVINGGTWELINDDKAIKIDVVGFKGDFQLLELTNSTLTLQQPQVQVDGKTQAANLEFMAGK